MSTALKDGARTSIIESGAVLSEALAKNEMYRIVWKKTTVPKRGGKKNEASIDRSAKTRKRVLNQERNEKEFNPF